MTGGWAARSLLALHEQRWRGPTFDTGLPWTGDSCLACQDLGDGLDGIAGICWDRVLSAITVMQLGEKELGSSGHCVDKAQANEVPIPNFQVLLPGPGCIQNV